MSGSKPLSAIISYPRKFRCVIGNRRLISGNNILYIRILKYGELGQLFNNVPTNYGEAGKVIGGYDLEFEPRNRIGIFASLPKMAQMFRAQLLIVQVPERKEFGVFEILGIAF